MDHRPKRKTQNNKTPRDNIGEKLVGLFRCNSKGTIHERINQLDFIKIKNLFSAEDTILYYNGEYVSLYIHPNTKNVQQ